MDHDAGRSTTSASKTFGDSVASCTISFQGHREVAQLYAALAKHALRTTGVLIQFGSLTGFVRRSEVLSLLPPALAPASCSATCTGVLAECVRSPSDVAKFASLFCDNDSDLALEWIAAGISELGTSQSPSTPGYLTLSVASPLRRASPLPFRVSRGLGDSAEEVVDEAPPSLRMWG